MKNINFVAVDIETANKKRSSVCEIGLSVVENSIIIESKSWIIKPEDNQYDSFNTYLHGIGPSDTENAPSFLEVWEEIRPYLEGNIVVAHNSAFDMYSLRDVLELNKITFPEFRFYCSYRTTKYCYPFLSSFSLPNVCKDFGIEFEETHRGEADSKACAQVFLKCLVFAEIETIDQLEEKFQFRSGEFSGNMFKPQLSTRTHSHSVMSRIKMNSEDIDEGSYFYGKTVCFTGAFTFGIRVELLQYIADVGGIPANSVTKSTDILVVGMQDYRVVGESGMSGKQRKAIELKELGQDIEVMSEREFLAMI